MNKVFLDTFWFMYGVESGKRSRLVSRAWLTSILPPFYRGTGIAIRLGKRSVRFGVCYPRMPVTVDEYTYTDTKENLEALFGHELPLKEARKWAYSPNDQTPTHTPPSSDESSPDSDSAT